MRCGKRSSESPCTSTMVTTSDYVVNIPPTAHNHDCLTVAEIEEMMIHNRVVNDNSATSTRYLLSESGLPYSNNINRRRRRRSTAMTVQEYVDHY